MGYSTNESGRNVNIRDRTAGEIAQGIIGGARFIVAAPLCLGVLAANEVYQQVKHFNHHLEGRKHERVFDAPISRYVPIDVESD